MTAGFRPKALFLFSCPTLCNPHGPAFATASFSHKIPIRPGKISEEPSGNHLPAPRTRSTLLGRVARPKTADPAACKAGNRSSLIGPKYRRSYAKLMVGVASRRKSPYSAGFPLWRQNEIVCGVAIDRSPCCCESIERKQRMQK